MDALTMLAIWIGSTLIDWASRISVALGRGAITPGPGGPFKVGSLVLGALILFVIFLGARSAGKKGKELFKVVAVSAGVLAIVFLFAIGITLVDLPRLVSTTAKVAAVRVQPVDVAGRPNPFLAADELFEAQKQQEERVLDGLCNLSEVADWNEYKVCYKEFGLAIGRAKSHAGSGVVDDDGSGLFVPVLERLEGHFYEFEALEGFATQYGFLQAQVVQKTTGVTVTIILSVTADVLNVRNGPGTSFDVTDKVVRDTRLEQLEKDIMTGWLRVKYNSSEGWVSPDYVTEVSRHVVEARVEVLPTPVPTPTDLPDLDELQGELVWLAQKTRAADAGALERWKASPCRESLCKDIRKNSLQVTAIFWQAKADIARSARSIADEERVGLLDEAAAMLRMIVAAAEANKVLDDQRVLIEEYIKEITK